jgi:ribosomal protein L7Ae-like RNA K-turn-binding protein
MRYVLAPDLTIVPDILAKLPGRGAYTCISRECLEAAIKRNQFSRAFKVAVEVDDLNGFLTGVASRFEERIASYVALANKAGKIITGTDMVMDAIRKNNAGVVVIAVDVSEEIGKKIAFLAARSSIPCCNVLTRDRLGSLVGKGLRSSVAIPPGDFAAVLLKEIERFRNFS